MRYRVTQTYQVHRITKNLTKCVSCESKMAAMDNDLELQVEDSSMGLSQPVKKSISLKLKSNASKSKRGQKKAPRKSREEVEQDVISEEEAPLTIIKPLAPPEPTHQKHKLKWDHKVHLIGEKVVDPLIHCCEKCELPILIYGRMIPCKHVFCLECAMKTEKRCSRCSDEVSRIEKSALGTVFVCTFGGAKHGVSGCRRTYLSQRDLQAHINYRHLRTQRQEQAPPSKGPPPTQTSAAPHPQSEFPNPGGPVMQHPPPPQQPPAMYGQHPPEGVHRLPPPQQHGPPPGHIPPAQPLPGHIPPHSHMQQHPPVSSAHIESYPQSIPVMSSTRKSNLISVPIQDESQDYRRQEQSSGNYPISQGHYPPQQHYGSGSHPAGPQSGPPPVSFTNPPPHFSGSHQMRPPHNQPPPGGPPPTTGPPPPHQQQRYSSPHGPFEDSPMTPPYTQPGSHSPRSWQGAPNPGGPQPRGPPPPQRQSNSSSGRYYQ